MFESAPSEWERITLGEIVERGGGSIQTGPFGSQLHASDYVPVGIPSIMPVNIGDNRLIRDGIACITSEDAQRLSKHIVRKGDIIYSRRGDVERRAIVRDAEDGWFCGTGCLKVRLGDGVIIPEFATYYLGHPEIRAWIVRHAVGATMPNLNTGIMQAVPFLLPPWDEQRAIASVLGSLDDKIELNRRMNRTLEQMAAAIFKAWFVDFEPVRAKAGGAATFPGMPQPVFDALPATFADSELGPIPEGWEVKTFGDLLELPYGKALKADNRRPGAVPVFGSNGLVGWHDESLVDGPGIVVGRKGNPGTVEWSETSFFPIDTTFYVKTKSKAPSLRLLYYQLKAANLARLSSDSAVPGVNRNAVYGDPCISSPREFTGGFDEAVAPLWSLMLSNNEESRILAETRDALLPKLLVGEVRVAHG